MSKVTALAWAACLLFSLPVVAANVSVEDAWKALPGYHYGDDMAALLTIDGEVIRAMASAESRTACAARLASLLEAAETTPAAKQYICLQLRQIGTPAEVPLLARLYAKPETSQIARYALESIQGEASIAALREGLKTREGDLLIGAINSVAARRDAASVARLIELAGGGDAKVASAAVWALGNIASPEAAAFVAQRAADAPVPALRCAAVLAAGGQTDDARKLYEQLSAADQDRGIRRAALAGLLSLEKDPMPTLVAWLANADPQRRLVAAGRLGALDDAQLDALAARCAELPEPSQVALVAVLAAGRGKDALPVAIAAIGKESLALKLAGINALAEIGDASGIAVLVDGLAAGGEVTEAAMRALVRLPREAVGRAMLAALAQRPELRGQVVEVLARLKYYEAIDTLLDQAKDENPKIHQPALDALAAIADPDDADLRRLVPLVAAVPAAQRDAVERTIVLVCDKLPNDADRAGAVLAVLGNVAPGDMPVYLPLLGRFGGEKVLSMVDAALANANAEARAAAVAALCKWPTAEVADRLWTIAGDQNNPHRRSALRAYVRVITLKSDRPEAETLAMLQKAMERADTPDDRQWVLDRASTVRTLEAVRWIAGYLDDAEVNQAACRSLVALAHHRFLRHPNMDLFGPLLQRVVQTSTDPAVVERAKKYRLGL